MKFCFSMFVTWGALGAACLLPQVSTTVFTESSDSAASFTAPPITSPASGVWSPGKHVWADLFTSEPQTASAFYTGLFGWSSEAVGSYILLKNGDHAVAGIANPPSMEKVDAKTHRYARWVGYFSVGDMAEALDNVKAAGGKVLVGERTVHGRGLQAIVADPGGAILGLIHSDSGDPKEPHPANAGDWVWTQLFVQTPTDVHGFYREVFQYEVREEKQAGGASGFIFFQGKAMRGGLAQLNMNKTGARPAWLGFVHVSDVEASAQKAVELGGRVLVKPRQGPGKSFVAIVADPLGGTVGLLQLSSSKNSSK